MNGETTTLEVLQKFEIRITDVRLEILAYFQREKNAVSSNQIEKNFSSFDRITIYRTLKTFVNKKIIHKILDNSGNIKYSLSLKTDESADNHIHFKCTKCDQTSCLNTIHIPEIKIPKDYYFQEINVLVTGICSNCKF